MSRPVPSLLVAIAVAAVATALLAFGAMDALELPLRDAAVRLLPREPATRTVVVAIDEDSLRAVGAWPWPRTTLAALVDRAREAGARGVVIDVLLAEPREGDATLARALGGGPSVSVSVLDEHGRWLLPAAPVAAATTAAHGNFELDTDGILRRLSPTKQSGDRALSAVSVEAASIVAPVTIPVGRSLIPAFRTPPADVPRLRAAELLQGFPAPLLRGRIAFIGPTALALGDRVLTPASRGHRPDPGVTVHAAATESLIRREQLQSLAPLAAGAAMAVAIFAILAARRRAALYVALAVGLPAAGLWALAQLGTAIPFATATIALLATALFVELRSAAGALRRSGDAAATMEATLGVSGDAPEDIDRRLEQLAEAIRSRRELDAESRRLLAHELRTPLASMRGLSQLLGSFDLSDAERRRVATLLESEAGKLQNIVQTLMQLESLSTRDFGSNTAVHDLSELVTSRVEFLGASSDRVRGEVSPLPVPVRCDPSLIERAIDNLVSNALRYTPGPAPITLRVTRDGEHAILQVVDGGPGIAEADRERVFNRFYRGASASGTEGLGLGLPVVAEIARWHRGTIEVSDAPGGGAEFRIELPVARGHEVTRSRGHEVARFETPRPVGGLRGASCVPRAHRRLPQKDDPSR